VSPLSHRDRAVLRAVAAGRCALSGSHGAALLVDGLCCADQFVGTRLTGAGLIAAPAPAGPAQLTPAGRALLNDG
jgi:hypothetical protein